MKKVTVLTFCTWTSIGSILQSLGLKKALTQIGCRSTILLPEDANGFVFTKVHSLKSLISRIFQMLIHSRRMSAYRKRCGFIEKHLDVEYYSDHADLGKKAETGGDCCLAGSDQIWNPDQCDRSFFLDFPTASKRISYAASMGKTKIPEENAETIKRYLNGFDRISVREKACKEALQQLTDREISVHIDPTFLVEPEDWRRLEEKYPVREPYILLYMIYWDASSKEQIRELKRRTGLPVYAICSALSRVYADKYLFDVGVEEFLWLVDHAEYVITSSFHGAAFATIFNKKFAAVVNPALPSRMENLLQTLGIPHVSIAQLDTVEDFDYCAINERIAQQRSSALAYLEEATAI